MASTLQGGLAGPGSAMRAAWIIWDTLGALWLLAAIVWLPVTVSDWYAPQSMPFQPRPPRGGMNISQSQPETNRAMRACVGSQLQMIREGRLSEAYSYASEGIQEVLSEEAFIDMISNRFSAMQAHDTIEMSDGLDDGTQGILRVRLSRQRRVVGVYTYIMMLEEESWKIGGVIPEYPNPATLKQSIDPEPGSRP